MAKVETFGFTACLMMAALLVLSSLAPLDASQLRGAEVAPTAQRA